MPGTPPKYNLPLGSFKNYKRTEAPDSILKIQPWERSNVNPDAGVYPYSHTPKFSKYGFLEKQKDENQLIGGIGIGFPRKGINLDFMGITPLEKNDYFKGILEGGISKEIGDFNVGASVDTAITGYPDRSGNFIKDKTKLNPKLKVKYNFKNGGAMAPIIPTWDYPSEKTFVRDTTDAPPRIFENGGGKDKRKKINEKYHNYANYASNYEWDAQGNPITIDDQIRDYYNNLNSYYNNDKKIIFTGKKADARRQRKQYKNFIKNTMDDLYESQGQKYYFNQFPDSRKKYSPASENYMTLDKTYSPEEGFDDPYILEQNTVDVSNNPTLLEKWRQRRNKAKMMNHVLAELTGTGDLPKGYNDKDWDNFTQKYEKALLDKKNELTYFKAKKDLKNKKGKYSGSDRVAQFLSDYKANNWIDYDPAAIKEATPGLCKMQDKINTSKKQQDFANLIELTNEMTMIPAAERIYAEPGRTITDFNNTILDLSTAAFVEGDINPLAYNYDTEEYGVPYWQGAQGAMDATALGSMLFPELRALNLKTANVGDDVVKAGFGFRRTGKSKVPAKLSSEQTATLKEINLTDQQIADFPEFMKDLSSTQLDDYIKKLKDSYTKTKASPAKTTNNLDDIGTADSAAEVTGTSLKDVKQNIIDKFDKPITKYDIDGNVINAKSADEAAGATLDDIKATVEAAPEKGYFKGKTEAQGEGVAFHKEAYINKLVEAHPDVNPDKIRTAIQDLRGESANETFTKQQILKDPEISFLAEKSSKSVVLPFEDKAIYADFMMENPSIYPRREFLSDKAKITLKDNLDLLDETASKTSSQVRSLNPEEEIMTNQFVHGYDSNYNFPGRNPLFQRYADKFNKLVTRPGNQLEMPIEVTRSDQNFFIDELGKNFSNLKVGDEFANTKFKSTTVGPEKSVYPHNAGSIFGNQTSLIKLPTGQSIYVPGRHPSGQPYISTELEGILPRNLRFKVDKVNTPYEQGLRSIDDITNKKMYLGNQEYVGSPKIKNYDKNAHNRLSEFLYNRLPFDGSIENLQKGVVNKDYFLRKSRLPWSNNYFAVEKPTFAGRQDFLNKIKSGLNTKIVKLNTEKTQGILDSYNRFKRSYPEKAKFEFSILNPYKRVGYLNRKYTYGNFIR